MADKLFKAETTGWALGAETVSVDLATPVPLSASQIEDIEAETNRMIASGAAVNWKVYSKEQILGQEGAAVGAESTAGISNMQHCTYSAIRALWLLARANSHVICRVSLQCACLIMLL